MFFRPNNKLLEMQDNLEQLNAFLQEKNRVVGELNQRIEQLTNDNKALGDRSILFQGLTKNLGLFSQSLTDMQGSLAHNADNMQEERVTAIGAQSASLTARTATERMVDNFSALEQNSRSVAEAVSQLDQQAQKIGGIVKLIRDIADQTNLLSLNASIEAARAGEHGRGFAVVADEVRKLAERTSKATNEIGDLVSQIRRGTGDSRQHMDDLASQAFGFSKDAKHAAGTVTDLLELSGRMEQAISASALRSFCELAKMDHVIFKFRVYKVLMGLSQETAENFSDHTACRLGKWYYQGQGKADFSSLPGFRDIEQPHREFHRFAVDAIKQYSGSNNNDMLENLEAMENASSQVIATLEKIALASESLSANL